MFETTHERQKFATQATFWSDWSLDCLGLLLLAAIFRFFWLKRSSLWADEIFSVQWSALDYSYLLGPGSYLETNPPTYYLLLKGWMEVFGRDAFAARSLSALAATAVVVVAYAIGRRLQTRAFGLLAGVFLAIDPNLVATARQARGYALLALVATLALLGLAEALCLNSQRRIAAMTLFAVCAVVTVFLHYTAVFFIAACFIAIVTRLMFGPERTPIRPWLEWIVVGVAIAIGISAPLLTAARMSHSANLDWIDPLSLETVWEFFRELFIGRARQGLAANSLCLLLMTAVVAGVWKRRPAAVATQIMVVIPLSFFLILLLMSLARPLLLARTGIWLTTPISLLLAWVVVGQRSLAARVATATVLILISAGLSWKVLTRPAIEDWRSTARFVLTEPKCGGPLVTIGPHVFDAIYYEARLADRPSYWVRLYQDQAETAEAALDRRLSPAKPLNPADLAGFLAVNPGASVIYRHALDKVADIALAGTVDAMSISQEEPGIHIYCR